MPESRNLDLLRATAVLLVLCGHLCLTLMTQGRFGQSAVIASLLYAGAQAGVLLFFVHTALVLLRSLDRMPGPRRAIPFLIRRAFRIYPLVWVAVGVVLLCRIPFVPSQAFEQPALRTIVVNLLLIQNLTHDRDLISVLWTLPLEIQMYAALPLIHFALKRFGSVPVVLAGWAIASAVAPRVKILGYVPCFAGGVLAFQAAKERTAGLPGWLWPVVLTALIAARLAIAITPFESYAIDFAFCAAVGGIVSHFKEIDAGALARVSHLTARYSYGIYLAHVPIIWLAFVRYPRLSWLWFVVLMLSVPAILFHAIENPMIRRGRIVASKLTQPHGSLDGALGTKDQVLVDASL